MDVQAIYANLPNFWVWEIGKAPDFALEVASPSTAANDVGPKRALYERLGVREYWRFDPTGGDFYGQALAGDRLVNGVYQPCETVTTADGVVRGHCALLGVDFSWNGASFDALDPETGKTIDKLAAELEARAADREALAAERAARLEAEAEIARLRGAAPQPILAPAPPPYGCIPGPCNSDMDFCEHSLQGAFSPLPCSFLSHFIRLPTVQSSWKW